MIPHDVTENNKHSVILEYHQQIFNYVHVYLWTYHKIFDTSVKYYSVVIAIFAVYQKVLTCFWYHITVEFYIQRTHIGDHPQISFLFYSLIF